MNKAQRDIIEDMVATHIDYGESIFRSDCERLVEAGRRVALVEAYAEIDRLNRRIEELEAGPEIGDGSIFNGGTKTSLSVDGMYAAIVLPEEALQPVIGADHPHPDVA